MKNNKQAQIHMTETIVVLLIFFIILFFGIFLYYNYTIKSIQETGQDIQEQKSQTQLQIISSMPEFSCADFKCIDTLKLLAFKQLNQDYTNTFGFKTIKIQQVYPQTKQAECTINNYPDCSTYTIYDNPKQDFIKKLDSTIATTLYFPTNQQENQYKIGKIILTYYE